MSYKTILTVLDSTQNAAKVSEFAIALANRFSSHVIGLHMETMAAVPVVAPMEIPDPASIQAIQDIAQKETKEIARIFEQKLSENGVSHEWRSFVSSVGYTSSSAVDSARCTDIVIAGQSDSSSLSDSRSDIESFLFESGRPVLLVPYILTEPKPIKRVLIAWNGSREATRAAFDALPFLKEAESVEIFTVDPPETATQSPAMAGAELAATLARHGVKVTVATKATSGTLSAHAAIENRLSDDSIDLLVMGAYTHSRWWEMLFGGVTRTLLDSMTALTLLSR
ncbi:nucleotide-binding universal stress UspA family protein [Rhizobium sp. BIGb0125]|jgi:nucleotide-binding universal stress UspA family protein|uniref:universal stress protein n=1 Tax=Rhizobium sp. BIGb0125 TaxID=2940618 RepID=UPI00216A5913|nr:universal stress protein [Rhizobium sp. BIGb0125]MCS4241439.1 nucleotide-binding universal stress UspA family protein [Rhizobium sp. BIGb0125]